MPHCLPVYVHDAHIHECIRLGTINISQATAYLYLCVFMRKFAQSYVWGRRPAQISEIQWMDETQNLLLDKTEIP